MEKGTLMNVQQIESEASRQVALYPLRNYYFIWRHGESEANVAEIIVSKPENGVDSWGLTETGVRQTRSSATIVSRLSRLFDSKSLIYTSPFLRCVRTAEEIAQVMEVPTALVAEELRERDFGRFEGKQASWYDRVYQLDRTYPAGHNFFDVESTENVSVRATGFVNRLEELFQGRVIILVTHADVGEILQASFYGKLSWEHRQLPKLKYSSPVNLRYRYIREGGANAVC